MSRTIWLEVNTQEAKGRIGLRRDDWGFEIIDGSDGAERVLGSLDLFYRTQDPGDPSDRRPHVLLSVSDPRRPDESVAHVRFFADGTRVEIDGACERLEGSGEVHYFPPDEVTAS